MHDDKDVLALLHLVCASMCQQTTNQAPVHSLIEAEAALHKFRQTENMSNTTCLEKLKSLIEVCEHAGAEPGATPQRVADHTDLTNVNEDNVEAVTAAAAHGCHGSLDSMQWLF